MAFFPCSSGGAEYEMRYFDVTINQAFTSGTTYDLSLSEFGLSSNDIVRGLAISVITGNQAVDGEGTLRYYYSSTPANRKFKYICKASNSTRCVFTGIMFLDK